LWYESRSSHSMWLDVFSRSTNQELNRHPIVKHKFSESYNKKNAIDREFSLCLIRLSIVLPSTDTSSLFTVFSFYAFCFIISFKGGIWFVPIVKRVLTTTVIAIYMYIWMNIKISMWLYKCVFIFGLCSLASIITIGNCKAFRDTWRHATHNNWPEMIIEKNIFLLIFNIVTCSLRTYVCCM